MAYRWQKMNPVINSSKDMNHRTPDYIFEPLDKIFSFKFDAAATFEDRKCEYFISECFDERLWPHTGEMSSGSIWINPPYGRGEKPCPKNTDKCRKHSCKIRGHHISVEIPGVGDFADMAASMAEKRSLTVCALLPSRTGEKWFFDHVWNRAEYILFFEGRIRFDTSYGKKQGGAPMPNVLAIYGTGLTRHQMSELSKFGKLIRP